MASVIPGQPSFHILICLIKIWHQESAANAAIVPADTMMITEAESIEIEETYSKLIGTAKVKFPRGTVIHKTVDVTNEEDVASDRRVAVSMSATGVLERVNRTSMVATTSHFNVGDRIRIYLGYTTDPEIARIAKLGSTGKTIFNDLETLSRYESMYRVERYTNIMFDGYICKVSVESPIELYCENLACKLKYKSCRVASPLKFPHTVNEFFGEEGWNLLKDTGLELHPYAKECDFDLGITNDLSDFTVAEVLKSWSKAGLKCFVTMFNGKPVLCIGRTYFKRAKKDSVINMAPINEQPIQILFDYHVAKNNLRFMSSDKEYLAVQAEGYNETNNNFINLVLIKNLDYDSSSEDNDNEWIVVNQSAQSKKAMKAGVNIENDIDMKLYTIVPYHSTNLNSTGETLLEEAKKYFEEYNMNGIEGSLELFGDLGLHTGAKIELVDKRYPAKNGYYLVDEVNTTFGVDGYRQTITIPYCIGRDGTIKTINIDGN